MSFRKRDREAHCDDESVTMAAFTITSGRCRSKICAAAAQTSNDTTTTTTAKTIKTTTTTEPPIAASAFGCTFFLAPTYCVKMEREDALQFSIFAKMTGFAYFFKSEMQCP